MSMLLPQQETQSSGMKIEHIIGITIILLLAIDVYIEYLMLQHMRGQGGTIRNEGDAMYHSSWHGGTMR